MIRVALIAVVVVTVVGARPTDACSGPHQSIFELFESAEHVAVAKVRSAPRGKARVGHPSGPVRMTVRQRLKGPASETTLRTRDVNNSCHVGFRIGRTALVFVGPDGYPHGWHQGYIEDHEAATEALVRWSSATDVTARTRFLVELVTTSADRRLVVDAAWYLAAQPALLAAITASQRDDLALAAGRLDARWSYPIQLVLVRLRSSAGVTIPQYQNVLAVTRFESVDDPGVLADAMAAGTDPTDPVRIAALERCERVHGKPLYAFSRYVRGASDHFWPELAAACRTGTPLRW